MSFSRLDQAETIVFKKFRCFQCSRDFKAKVITWVDVSRAKWTKNAILQQEFNVVACAYCGGHYAADEVPFFYEDFEEGLLLAVFLKPPENRDALESQIRKQYKHYPLVEFIYSRAHIWLLLYLQNFIKEYGDPRSIAMNDERKKQTASLLRLLREDPVMVAIKERLNDVFLKTDMDEDLTAVLGQAIYRLEGLYPWPLDRRCVCGTNLVRKFTCCNKQVNFDNQALLSSRNVEIVCPSCGKAFASVTCRECDRTYTWHLGVVDSLEGGEDIEHLFPRIHGSFPHADGSGMEAV